ncbi:DUF7059 domain-containing protein [Streptomyces litchfieldiae]|uniref:Methyltransferase n=1 Tax=Streptomyces litchfieldiae TaxID=3075543 RepID=A0ABU2MJT3_9ACTN|nr:methyltransferase [Streptomyces sp. DSM 44938]MDT0341872.1 methyltransferase [Streptomyces sp. DSM 44938]
MSIAPLPALPVTGPGTPRLREALWAASFTPDGLRALLGEPAHDALTRGEPVPALRAVRGDDGPLAVLARLFLLRQPVAYGAARGALPLDAALGEGWLERDGDEVRATVDVRPYAGEAPDQDWWIVSDARGLPGAGEPARDVVLGAGGASTTLAQLTVRRPVARALDLGTGCGVQALHASRHAARVTATDVNARALRMAALTLALSGAPAADLRQGSLFEPVADKADKGEGEGADEGFGLIVSNPPFVISPSDRGAGLTYRDGGLAGDELCRTLVRQSAAHLADGGHCQLLANWQHIEGEDWRERVAAWVPPGCDAWIVQREIQDVTRYAELWLRDAGLHRGDPAAYDAAYEAWLADFAAARTEAVGLGWITLRASRTDHPSVVVEDWPHAVEQPLGDTVAAHFARRDFLRGRDDGALLRARYVLAEDVVQEQIGSPGAEDPEHVVLRQRHGMLRARAMDTVSAGFAGSCDGTLVAGAILDAIASLLDEDAVALRDRAGEWLRPLVEQGFLLPEE